MKKDLIDFRAEVKNDMSQSSRLRERVSGGFKVEIDELKSVHSSYIEKDEKKKS
jgi:hypothetical protein